MMPRRLLLILVALIGVTMPNKAHAAKDNTFSAGVFLGDSYAPNNFRLSLWSVDIGASDLTEVYVGSRRWIENYYAGFGFGSNGSIYGLVGYEWRFIPWMGLSAEFDGAVGIQGSSAGRAYIGIVAGW